MALVDRLFALFGLDFDFSFDIRTEPFHAITPTLTLGSRPRPEQLGALRERGITHTISCLEEGHRPAVAFLDDAFETLFLPLRDRMDEDIGARFPAFFDFLAQAGDDAQVLVHCEVGVSRSATLATAHVMKAERLRFYEAYRAVRTRRPQVLPNVAFASALQRLEHTLFPRPRAQGYASLTTYLREVCNVPVEMAVLQDVLEDHEYDAPAAIRAIFGGEIPRVVQGVRR